MEQTRKGQSKVDASIRAGKAWNGPGKGNPKQMQVLWVEKHKTDQDKAIQSRCKYYRWKSTKQTKIRQSKADASIIGGKAQNRPG